MALPLQALRDTHELGKGPRCGIWKHWPLESEASYQLHGDYIQKVCYAVQDFNSSVAGKESLTRETVVFMVALVDWIYDGIKKILSCYKASITSEFAYYKQKEMTEMEGFFRATRSFISAHPLGTNRHKNYGLDGSFICIDIQNKSRILPLLHSDLYELAPNGLTEVKNLGACDIILLAYSKSSEEVRHCHIGIKLEYISYFASLCIDKLYEFDKFLGGLKQRDFN